MFVQTACVIPKDKERSRKILGLAYACLIVFICLSITNFVDYVKQVQKNNYMEWDVKTITAGDYSVEFRLDKQFYQDFLDIEFLDWARNQKFIKSKDYVSRVEAFRDWIQHEMQRRLDQIPDLGYEEEPVEHVKIAITTFAFKNPDIINLLKERGDIIKNERWKDMGPVDENINKIKKEKIDDLMTPVAVFMTFECEEGVNRAMAFNEIVDKDESLSHLRKWLGHHTFEIKKAPEPSDIIWENRHFTTFDRLKQKVKNFIWIFLLLAISFACVYIGAVYSLNSLYTYPDVNCDSLPLINSPQLMEDAAFREWTENQHLEKTTTERIVYYGYV